jgi:Polyketide cyclase / dehydrase and lipid transport
VIATVSTVIAAPVDTVWPWLDDFTGWHRWLPTIVSTTMADGADQAAIGCVRILQRTDGSTIRERLLTKDARHRTMSYDFDGPHPFPVRRYVGNLQVEPVTTDDATFIRWWADFDCDTEAEAANAATFCRIYLSFFDALRGVTVAAGSVRA